MSTLTKRDYPGNGISLANFFPNLESWAVGFDRPMRLLDEMSNALTGRNNSFPPYNIKQLGEDRYQIEMAVAGFAKKDLKIELHNNQQLSDARAKATLTYLKRFVPKLKSVTRAYAYERRITDESTTEALYVNRRAEVAVS